MEPNRILIQIGNDMYAYQTGDFGCKTCDVPNYGKVCEICCAVETAFKPGAFFKRNIKVVIKED